MATQTAIANGDWDVAGTWSTAIPGTGDHADLAGFRVTLKDTRRIFTIRNTVNGGRLILQSSLGAPILRFDDTSGAGFEAVTFASCFLIARGTASTAAKVVSFNTPPTNAWSDDPNLNLKWRGVRATFADFSDLIPAAEPSWTEIFNLCEFRASASAKTSSIPRNQQRWRQCTFVRCNVSLSSPDGYVAALSSCIYSSGSTFVPSANAGNMVIVSKNHDVSAGDYRVAAGNDNANVGAASMADLEVADRPVSTDNLRLFRNQGSPALRWDISATVATFTVDNKFGLVMAAGSEIITRGQIVSPGFVDFPQPVFSLASTARIIQHAFGGERWKLLAGTMVRTSILGDTFSSNNRVEIYGGTLRMDADSEMGTSYLHTGGRIMLDAGRRLSIKAGSTFTAPVGNLVSNGTASSPSFLRSTQSGTLWRFIGQRGTLVVADGRGNYAIQNLQHPFIDYWRPTRESRMAYMNNDAYQGRWGVVTYRHASNTWSTVINFDTTNNAANDGHEFPSVMHDNDGFVHIFYGAHQTELQHARSNSTNSIQSWTLATNNPVHPVTYPQMARTTGGTFYMMHRRGNTDTWFRRSTNNMNSWTLGTAITQAPGVSGYDLSYPFGMTLGTNSGTQRIHIFGSWRAFDASIGGQNPWYLRSNDGGTTWRTANGTALSLPVVPGTSGSPLRMQNLYEQTGTVDSNGNPHLFAIRDKSFGGYSDGSNVLFHMYHNGTTWSTFRMAGGPSGRTPNWGVRSWYDITAGKVMVLWDETAGTYNFNTGSTIAETTVYLSKWTTASSLATWSTETVKAVRGPHVLMPLFPNGFYVASENQNHLFWQANSNNPAGVAWENYGVRVAHAAMDVKDSDAGGGITLYAYPNSTDSGGNTNWIFSEAVAEGLTRVDVYGLTRSRRTPFKWTRRL